LPDLVFISSFFRGTTLPPLDYWLPPFKFDFYYTLQYYGAALAGRILHMTPSLTYNLCAVFLSGMSLALVWDLASRFVPTRLPRLLLVAAIAFGGTGVSIFTHIAVDAGANQVTRGERMWGSARFIGEYDNHINTEIGHALFPRPGALNVVPRALGMENFGYQYFLGEYHAPLGGYFLLLLALAAMAALQGATAKERSRKRCLQAVLGFSIPVVFATNTWMFPFQFLLIAGWALWNAWQGRKNADAKPDWIALIGSAAVGFVLLYPFLAGFATRAVSTPISLVRAGDHTPVAQFLGLFWPLLVFFALGLWQKETRRLTLFFTLIFAAFLLISEVIYVDDPSGDQFERSNTVMKWWGWIWSGGLAALGAVLLGARARWVRVITGVTLASTLVFAFDTVSYWWHDRERGGANLYGSNVYTSDPVTRDMFLFMNAAPYGIVLENSYGTGYHEGGSFAAFSGKPLFVGWANQLGSWRGNMEIIGIRHEQLRKFYAGEMPNALMWLLDNEIRYVVWNRRDARAEGLWEKQNAQLMSLYAWQGFGQENGKPIGLWVRRERQ
ncbi:MAG: DUF2298 domain-containing protein, partial [Pseudomonadota bacterium]